MCLSTSGNSDNVVRAAMVAKECCARVIGLTGGDGGKLAKHLHVEMRVRSSNTARIQEFHHFALHYLCAALDEICENR